MTAPWIWFALALVLAGLEALVPAWLFLGFALGAAVVGVVLAAGGPFAGMLAGSLPLLLAAFAVFSLAAWAALRQLLGVRRGQVRLWRRDINEVRRRPPPPN